MLSYVYIGYDHITMLAKIGQTTQNPNARAKDIRKRTDKAFQLLSHKAINEMNIKSGTMSIAVEAFMRARLMRAGFTQIGNDHFQAQPEQLNSFIKIAQKAANDYCEIEQWGCGAWS